MAITHGKQVDVFLNQFDLTPYLNSMDLSREVDTPESTVFGLDDRTYLVGLRGGTVSLSGFWDNTATLGSDAVLEASLGVTASKVVTIGTEGTAVGDVVYLFSTFTTSYNITGAVDGIVEISTDLQATGQIDSGYALHALTAETATDITNAISVDQVEVTTTAGAVGHLHVSALSGATSLAVVISDSTNDSTFASLITFTTVTTALTAERVATSATEQVDRYVSVGWTIVGTSYTFAVGFARR